MLLLLNAPIFLDLLDQISLLLVTQVNHESHLPDRVAESDGHRTGIIGRLEIAADCWIWLLIDPDQYLKEEEKEDEETTRRPSHCTKLS